MFALAMSSAIGIHSEVFFLLGGVNLILCLVSMAISWKKTQKSFHKAYSLDIYSNRFSNQSSFAGFQVDKTDDPEGERKAFRLKSIRELNRIGYYLQSFGLGALYFATCFAILKGNLLQAYSLGIPTATIIMLISFNFWGMHLWGCFYTLCLFVFFNHLTYPWGYVAAFIFFFLFMFNLTYLNSWYWRSIAKDKSRIKPKKLIKNISVLLMIFFSVFVLTDEFVGDQPSLLNKLTQINLRQAPLRRADFEQLQKLRNDSVKNLKHSLPPIKEKHINNKLDQLDRIAKEMDEIEFKIDPSMQDMEKYMRLLEQQNSIEQDLRSHFGERYANRDGRHNERDLERFKKAIDRLGGKVKVSTGSVAKPDNPIQNDAELQRYKDSLFNKGEPSPQSNEQILKNLSDIDGKLTLQRNDKSAKKRKDLDDNEDQWLKELARVSDDPRVERTADKLDQKQQSKQEYQKTKSELIDQLQTTELNKMSINQFEKFKQEQAIAKYEKPEGILRDLHERNLTKMELKKSPQEDYDKKKKKLDQKSNDVEKKLRFLNSYQAEKALENTEKEIEKNIPKSKDVEKALADFQEARKKNSQVQESNEKLIEDFKKEEAQKSIPPTTPPQIEQSEKAKSLAKEMDKFEEKIEQTKRQEKKSESNKEFLKYVLIFFSVLVFLYALSKLFSKEKIIHYDEDLTDEQKSNLKSILRTLPGSFASFHEEVDLKYKAFHEMIQEMFYLEHKAPPALVIPQQELDIPNEGLRKLGHNLGVFFNAVHFAKRKDFSSKEQNAFRKNFKRLSLFINRL